MALLLTAVVLFLSSCSDDDGSRNEDPAREAATSTLPSDRPLRVLLSNDDGWDAPGIVAMRDAMLAAGWEVWEVAPLTNRSGSSMSTTQEPLDATQPLGAGARIWAVDGSPVDSVTLGLRGIMLDDPPDVVVSGVNAGANVGLNVNYSGTVGVALAAREIGVPAVAVSGDVGPSGSSDLATASSLVLDLVPALSLGENIADTYPGDFTEPAVHTWDFRDDPGLWVRLRLSDVHDAEDFRRVIPFSTHDGFTSCLFRAEAANEVKNGVLGEQPWNLKTAYQAVRVLGDDWLSEVESADSQLRLRAFDEQWVNARDRDIPRSIEMMTRSTFYLFVYDEDVPEMMTVGGGGDGGAPGMAELQIVPHPVRIQLVDLKKKKLVMRRRLTADSSYRLAGDGAPLGQDTERAVRRQVQNCQLGRDFWKEVSAD